MSGQELIGKTYGPVTYEIGVEKIREYARATNDGNPVYDDEDAAKAMGLAGIVAPPMFAVVYLKDLAGKMLFDRDLDINFAMLVHGEQEFEFHDVVRPRDVVRSTGTLLGIDQKDEKTIYRFEVTAEVEGRLVTSGVYTFVVRG
ncbi:MaoC family dehydratase N-terminal domain-containing protein [bacterium]|nr:MaoC family dehydratase N-terminal domain-containing protein [bacterium]